MEHHVQEGPYYIQYWVAGKLVETVTKPNVFLAKWQRKQWRKDGQHTLGAITISRVLKEAHH